MATDEARHQQRARSFGSAAELYDSIRPSYPHAALAWALEPLAAGPCRVADIGAGTGIMTRLLIDAGHDVVAVEPDPAMRARLVEVTPAVPAVAGSAESLPLPDASLDAAVAAQAYHWFDHERAHAELARVIRPGGVFAAIWNDRDESLDWVAEYTRRVGRDQTEGHWGPLDRAVTSFGPRFGPVEVATFHHATRLTPDGLLQLLRSRSYYLASPPSRQRELEESVADLTAHHPELAGRTEFELPYVTSVYRSVRSGSPAVLPDNPQLFFS